ncbi:hypothetical protein Tsubulata_010087 [Turnera subulata]|uniref:U3 small nucleolar RNA-associated protein 25 n=1 Tax=Turnera subulata TaxID=218843 RepID=A0A9Q0FA40_9ROSI|nr:hypothetical protein Tsubulata_010087 [Turnera subulata]
MIGSRHRAMTLRTRLERLVLALPPYFSNSSKGEADLVDVDNNSTYGLKEKLNQHWLDIYQTSGRNDFHLSKQKFFFSLCNSYRDILHCNKKPFYLKGPKEDSSTMDAYLMHCLNHLFRTRDLVTKNDSKVAKHRENALLVGDDFLDQGFTRPKVLILLPFRNIAHRVVNRLIQLTPQAYKTNVGHMDRFLDEFGPHDDEDNGNSKESSQSIGNSKSQKSSKPSDFQALFHGNCDDNFMIGIKFTRKSIKLFNDFYSSDLIVASPFSIRCVLIIDHADVITMQNWDFAKSVLEELNHIPSNQHGTDIMRIRKWYLDGHAKFYRQTIILGSYVNPDINASFNQQCVNYQGKVKLVCKNKGVLPKVSDQVRQVYERFDAESVANADDARLDYFVQKVFPKIKDSDQIRGIHKLILYSLPERKEFYHEVVNMLNEANDATCTVLFSQFDLLRVKYCLGSFLRILVMGG